MKQLELPLTDRFLSWRDTGNGSTGRSDRRRWDHFRMSAVLTAPQPLPGINPLPDPESAAQPLTRGPWRSIVVPGRPGPMPRAKFNRHTGFAYTPAGARARKTDFATAWLDAGHGAFDRGVPLAVEVEFVFPRPGSHYGTGKNAGILKPRFIEARPGGGANGGDVDNLYKLAIDALEGIAFFNDSQIAMAQIEKRYAGPPFASADEPLHTRVAIRPI